MRKLSALCLVTALGCVHHPATPAPVVRDAPPPVIPATWTLRSQPVTAPHAMVVTAHPLATQAGVDILKQGGNAIDAVVAVAFALEVVLPEAGNIGGGGFIVHRTASGEVSALDYREAAPSGASHDMYLDATGNLTDKSLVGHLASGVPGSVAGLHEAWKRYGSLPWATLLAPAIHLAQGHLLDSARSRDIGYEAEMLAKFPASRAQFLVHDSAPPPGTMFRQPDLARTLQLISDSGPDVFYRGQIAGFGTPAYVHLLTEAMRRAFIDRNHWLGAPDFVDMPLDRLLSKSYAATLRSQIDPQHATPTPPQAKSGSEGMNTTHYSVVDAQGNAAAVTTTLN